MMIARFQVPSREVINLISNGDKIEAIKVWRNQDHRLSNGVRVRPRLQRCMDMIRAVEAGFGDIPMVIPSDGYDEVTEISVSGSVSVGVTKKVDPMQLVWMAALNQNIK